MPNTLLRTTAIALSLIGLASSLAACVAVPPTDTARAPSAAIAIPGETAAAPQQDEEHPMSWTDETHGNKVDPNYDVVFPVDAVNTLTITIAPGDWAAMQADMEDIYAPSLYIRKAMLEASPDLSKEEREKLLVELFAQKAKERTADPAPVTATEELTGTVAVEAGRKQFVTNRSPMWVPATITFQGREWKHVGVRYKGASSLSPYIMGDMRLPFKFDFDKFEDDYPEIDNQRFFGFEELSLANNYEDPAGMRDTVVYEVLAAAGLPSLRTAPYEIALDYGEGPVRLGLYTMVEVVDDTGVPSYFGDDDGNIYEGEGRGVSLATQDSHLLEDSFEKKNNEDKEDWSDIWALYDALNSEKRTSDPEAWRAGLEAVFDVDGFLEWLGIAAGVGHADAYGAAYHNFYLCNNPATGKLTWFSWDHNLTFSEGFVVQLTLDKANVTGAWPLIRYLLDDPVYWDRYVELMAKNFATVLAPDALIAKIRSHAELIAPVATRDMSPEEYDAAVQVLVDFVEARAKDVGAFFAAHE